MKKTTAALLNAIRDGGDKIKNWGIAEHQNYIMVENEKKNTRPKHNLYVTIAKEEAQTFLNIAKPEVQVEISDGHSIALIFRV